MSGALLAKAAFSVALSACAARYPDVRVPPSARIEATAAHESGFQIYAIHDNATGEVLAPSTLEAARQELTARLAREHRLDVGVMQVSSPNWAAYGLTAANAFDVEANVCAGARIYAQDYLIERRASCRYNSGSPVCTAYADSVERAEDRLSATLIPSLGASASCGSGKLFVRVIGDDALGGPGAKDGTRTFIHFGDNRCPK